MKSTRKKGPRTRQKPAGKRQRATPPSCRITFRFPKEAARGAERVTVVGDFNNWNVTETPMRKLKNGDFMVTLELPCNREYRFRYLVDAHHWENDRCADRCIPNPYGSEDSVLVV